MNSDRKQCLTLSTYRLRGRVAAVAGTVLLAAAVAACAPSAASSPATSAPASAPAAVTAVAQPAVTAQAATATPATRPTAAATTPAASAATTAASSAAATTTPAPASTAPAAAATAAQTVQAATATKINLNTAAAADILKVPGVGNQMLREFQEYKPYTSILQFRREIGKYTDAQTVAGYEQYVYVPISVGSADAATLQQIPGLDATEAAALIAGRPYASNEAFLSKLAEYVSAAELAIARSYLSTP